PEDRGRSAQSVELAEAGRATRQVACQHGRVGHVAGRQPIEPARLQGGRSEEHTSELQSRFDLVCRLLLEKKKQNNGLGLKPLHGWSSLSFLRQTPSPANIEAQVDAMASSGLKDVDYPNRNMDDF